MSITFFSKKNSINGVSPYRWMDVHKEASLYIFCGEPSKVNFLCITKTHQHSVSVCVLLMRDILTSKTTEGGCEILYSRIYAAHRVRAKTMYPSLFREALLSSSFLCLNLLDFESKRFRSISELSYSSMSVLFKWLFLLRKLSVVLVKPIV